MSNLTSKTDRKGQTIQYVYDVLNRLTQKSYPDSTSVDYVYDLVGKISQVTDPTGTDGFAYDNMGPLIETTTQYTFLPTTTFSNTYTYDAASPRLILRRTRAIRRQTGGGLAASGTGELINAYPPQLLKTYFFR